jgi:hypothetical protein
MSGITFAVAVNDREILRSNFMASQCFGGVDHPHEILIQEGFSSASAAYNDAIDKSQNDLIVFCHQDVLFPKAWLSQLHVALSSLTASDPRWGVLGCYGETLHDNGRGHVYSPGRGILGRPAEPAPVQTLDEIVLILRKSSGLRFDDRLPHYHFYGADICMEAASRGMRSYAISAFCIHNSQFNLVLPKEFYECYRYIKHKWRRSLPIQTTCVRVGRFDLGMYGRRVRELFVRSVIRRPVPVARVKNGTELFAQRQISEHLR